MKKGNKKNRHFSKGIHRLKNRNRDFIGKESKLSAEKSRSEQLAELSLFYQSVDFFIDRIPQLVKIWLNLFGIE